MQAKLQSDLLRGHTETIVLGLLLDSDKYGFEIYNAIMDLTEGEYELKETTLYSSYKRLETIGAISSYWGDETHGARRKYYHIEDKGKDIYRQNRADWKFTKKILSILLKEDQNDV